MLTQGPILVPLDGSELAEGALPYANTLAEALRTHVVLATIWEGADADLASAFPQMEAEVTVSAQTHFEQYLEGMRQRLRDGDKARIIVRPGDAEEEIEKIADEVGARAIAIATHGRSGIGRWVYGSTAGRLMRSSKVPLLVVGPNALESKRDATPIKRILVPLDGSDLAEAALPVAATLAKATGATIALGRAVRWAVQAYPYTLPASYVPQIDEELEKGAKEYLRRMEASVQGAGKVEAFVVRGAVADGLIDLVEQQSIDIVVMTTNARGGLARAALGSVADRMLQGRAPVLLVRPA